MTQPNPEQKSKLIIDEDWKSQVAAEREKLKEQEEHAPEQGEQDQLPEASLGVLAQMLSAQALSALGQFPDPAHEGRVVVHLEYAKLQIDLLAVLLEKTKGNATPDEVSLMDETLHQLRMLFVNVQREVAAMIAREQQKQSPLDLGGIS
jgi:hypothetical protein